MENNKITINFGEVSPEALKAAKEAVGKVNPDDISNINTGKQHVLETIQPAIEKEAQIQNEENENLQKYVGDERE